MINLQYNKNYYQDLFEKYSFIKDFDTISYRITYEDYDYERIESLHNKLLNRYDLKISHTNFKDIDNEIKAVHSIILEATNDIIFDDPQRLKN